MQHETTVVKKAVKKYKTADGVKKESISKRIALKKDSIFEIGDEIALLPIDEFNKLSDATDDDIAELEKAIADKDAIIDKLNESNAKLNAELKDKFNIIDDVTAKIKASEKTVVNLKSDISAKDKTIDKLTADVNVVNATISKLENKIDELSAINDELNELLDNSKAELINDKKIIDNYKLELAKYDAVNIDKLLDKADELDSVKDELIEKTEIIALSQRQIMEYIQLVNFKDKEISAYQHQGLINKMIGRNPTIDLIRPELKLIDSSGNPIADNDDDIVDVNADDVSKNENGS